MIPIAQIKKDLSYSKDLADVIEVLKLIASSEFGSLSARMPKEDILRSEIIGSFRLLRDISKDNEYFIERRGAPRCYMMVCSDEGFLGEVNTHVVNAALNRGLRENARFIVLGERGARLLSDSGVEAISFPSVKNDIEMEDVTELADLIMRMYKKGEIGALHCIFMRFLSFTSHRIDTVKLLPCDEVVDFMENKDIAMVQNLIEPDPKYVLEYLVKLWLKNNIYNIFWSSKLSEWSVRVMHLEHSADELKEINKDLKFKYFKSVHAQNDKVIREIFATRAIT